MNYDRPFPFILNFLPGFAREKKKENFFSTPFMAFTWRILWKRKKRISDEEVGGR